MSDSGDDDAQEKTEEPTDKKKSKAKEDGQAARSKELGAVLLLLATSIMLLLYGEVIINSVIASAYKALSVSRENVMSETFGLQLFGELATNAILTLIPLFLLLFVVAILSAVVVGGWTFSLKALLPKGSKLNPIKGMKKFVSMQSLMELAKSFLKFVFILSVGIAFIWSQFEGLMALSALPVNQGIIKAVKSIGIGLLTLSASIIIIALIDVPFQMYSHMKKMRMSHKDIKDENKDAEGDPHLKGKIKSKQLAIAQQRMMQEIPKADVVVINPEHFSVALRYDPSIADAPRVIAKGLDHMALWIRTLANQHNIQIISVPPLARSLYYTTELFQEVPIALYEAVAVILAHVTQLKRHQKKGGLKPILPGDIPIPDGFEH